MVLRMTGTSGNCTHMDGGPEMQTMLPYFLVYSLAYFAECEAKERLADEVSTGGMCNALSLY